MDGHREKSVDQLSVGMLASLMQLQGCRGYTPIDSARAAADLRELRAATPAAEARQQVRDDLQSFWSRLRRLRRGRRSSRHRDSGSRGSRSRSDTRREKRRCLDFFCGCHAARCRRRRRAERKGSSRSSASPPGHRHGRESSESISRRSASHSPKKR
eukprot:s1340_g13.t2